MITLSKKHKLIALGILPAIIIVTLFYLLKNKTIYTNNAYLKSDITIIRSKITGYITEVLVKDNQKVAAGDIIATIDDTDFKLKVTEAQSYVDSAIAKLAGLDNKLAISEFNINKAALDKDSAKIRAERADKDFKRAKTLVKDNSVSQQELDKNIEMQNNTKNAYDAASADYDAALLQKKLVLIEQQESKAMLAKYQASLALAQIDLENTKIRALTSGTISRKNLQVGQLAIPNLALAFIIQNDIWVIANYKETQTGEVKIGDKSVIEIDSLDGKVFYGKVESISPATGSEFSVLPPENATGNFTKIVQRIPVKITFDQNQDLSALKSGLSAEVNIELK